MIDIAHSRQYRTLAISAAVLLLLFGLATVGLRGLPTVVFGPDDSVGYEVIGFPSALGAIGILLTAAAPLVALRSTWGGLLLAALVPLWLVWIFDVWAFTSFAGLLAVAVIAMGRSPWHGLPVALVAMVFPLTLLGHTTMTMPDRQEIYLHYGGHGTSEFVVTESLYAVGILLVLGGGWILRQRSMVVRDAAQLSERAHLARDLHDVVAHHVSLIAVRAETAPYTVPDLGAGGRDAMADIATEARLAMTELRGVLGVLRRADGSVDLAPQPKGSDVAALVRQTTGSGAVTYEGDELLVALPSDQGYVAYRFVQEALTNARRHEPGAAVAVRAASVHDGVRLSVSNPTGATVLLPGGGLTGMRERVEAVGGDFRFAIVDGEVVVEAVLPQEWAG